MIPSHRALVAAGVGLLLLVACSSSNSGSDLFGSAASCADAPSIASNIFRPSCAKGGCHTAADRAAGLDLSVSDPTSELVGAASGTCDGWERVAPGSPDKSLLYQKVAGTPPCGAHMPLTGPELTSDEKECIRTWINGLHAVDAGSNDSGGDASCGDTQSSASNCGACGNVCPVGASCAAGKCACSGGLTACGATCVDTHTDRTNCGKCGMVCPTSASCTAGACSCPSTASTVCSGACVDTQSDPKNCGGCGKVCATGSVCNQGQCTSGCGSLKQCGQSCVDTTTSFSNCGACGTVCPAGATCSASKCVCPAGQTACNGTCIDTTTDPSNCGGCGTVCPSGTTCSASKCVCANGGTLCSGVCALTQSDPSNCGGCGVVCAPGQTCSAGKCTCGTASVSFSGAVQPIFTANCALVGCHTGAAPKEGLDLASGKSYASLVNVTAQECTDGRKRVKPADPDTSYIVQKLTNVAICSGTQMPKTGGTLPTAEIQTIANWICEGAPNN